MSKVCKSSYSQNFTIKFSHPELLALMHFLMPEKCKHSFLSCILDWSADRVSSGLVDENSPAHERVRPHGRGPRGEDQGAAQAARVPHAAPAQARRAHVTADEKRAHPGCGDDAMQTHFDKNILTKVSDGHGARWGAG